MDDSLFAKLSPELRNEIWALTVTNPTDIFLVDTKMEAPPFITRTCKQIRAETLGLFYRCNKFAFSENCIRHLMTGGSCEDCDVSRVRLAKLNFWLDKMGDSMLAALGSIRILVNSYSKENIRSRLVAVYTEISYNFKPRDCEGRCGTPELHARIRVPPFLVHTWVELSGYESMASKMKIEAFHKRWLECELKGDLVVTYASSGSD